MKSSARPGWPTFLDGAFDGAVLAFAAWTVFYQFALAYQFSMLWAAWPWMILAACSVVAGGAHALRRAQPDVEGGEVDRRQPPPGRELHGSLAIGALALLVLLVAGRERWGVWPVAVTAIGLLVFQLVPWFKERLTGRADRTAPYAGSAGRPVAVGQGAHVVALGASLGFGVLGMFLLRPDADDAFYVNRATWVAEHGTAATNDTMFGPNNLPPSYSGGLLTPSIESLQGVVAHALHIQAASLCYLLAVPVLGTMAGWTTWRLVRAWATRRHVWVMVAAMAFLVASGDSVVGGYSLGRIWQGKATAYVILIPLVWLLLSRTVDRARRTELVMLAAAGVAFVGLTTTSALLAPVITGAALVAAAILRSRSLALGALVFLAGPLANGLAQAFGPAAIGGGGDNTISDPQGAFAIAFGVSAVMILFAVVSMVVVPRSVPGPSGVLLACGAVATMVALLPGVFELADAVTGAGAVAWRLVISMPLWVLVGLVVTLPPPAAADAASQRHRSALPRAAAGAVTAAVIIVPLVFGTLLWNATGASLTSRPTWKVNQEALADVRAAQDVDVPPGLWLLPPPHMEVLAISTVGPFAVVPRHYYLPGLVVSDQERADRTVLFNLVSGLEPVEVREVADALDRLDVSLACVSDAAEVGPRVLRRATGAELRPVAHLNCSVR